MSPPQLSTSTASSTLKVTPSESFVPNPSKRGHIIKPLTKKNREVLTDNPLEIQEDEQEVQSPPRKKSKRLRLLKESSVHTNNQNNPSKELPINISSSVNISKEYF